MLKPYFPILGTEKQIFLELEKKCPDNRFVKYHLHQLWEPHGDGSDYYDWTMVDYAAKAAVVAGRGISRIIEASERGLPYLSSKLEVNSIPASEMKRFASVSQPAVKKLISEKFGKDGVSMLEAMQKSISDTSM